jgi:PmbA protein
MSRTPDSLIPILQDLVADALKNGADAADAVLVETTSLSVSWRLGKLEDVERSEAWDVGLRAFSGKRQAISSTGDLRAGSLAKLAARVTGMAKQAPEDPYCGLADPALLAKGWGDLDLYDAQEPDAALLQERARACEGAALAVPGITNSEGASAGWGRSSIALVTSSGFAGAYRSSSHSVSVIVLGGADGAMERDYDFSSTHHGGDLDDPEAVGRRAAEKTLKRLNPRKGPTMAAPVVFDPRVSMSLAGHFAGAVNGASIARGVSFLKDKMGARVFRPGVSIIDDPLLRRGMRSKPFDAEGLATARRALAEDGVLTSWVLDCASARQLGLAPTGNGGRGTSTPPGPSVSNLYMTPGTVTPADMIRAIKQGFYVTELIGMGVNGVTGDYSRGATGFWIENGELAYPVNEVTIAGNLKDMFLNLTPADDLVMRYGTTAPTVLVEGMTLAGT